MSLKNRLQKRRELKSFSYSDSSLSDFDLISYFQEHKELNSLTVYSHNQIYAEKDGYTIKVIHSFSSVERYIEQINNITEEYGAVLTEENHHCVIPVSNNIFLEVFFPPLAKNEPIVIISGDRNKSFQKELSNTAVSKEITKYLQKCLEKKVNIFIAGSSDVDKVSLMNFLIRLCGNDKRLVLCEKYQMLLSENPCGLRFSMNFLKDFTNIKYDNVFCSDLNSDDLINVFKAILSGFNGFVSSFSVNIKSDLLMMLRNLLLLSNINLFEENADFMVVSSMQTVVFVENDEFGKLKISKISEMTKNNLDENILKDIFIYDKSGFHVSTGIKSNFLNNFDIDKNIFTENKKHSYSDNEFSPSGKYEISSIENQTKSKLEKLKSKLKKKKSGFITEENTSNVLKNDEDKEIFLKVYEETKQEKLSEKNVDNNFEEELNLITQASNPKEVESIYGKIDEDNIENNTDEEYQVPVIPSELIEENKPEQENKNDLENHILNIMDDKDESESIDFPEINPSDIFDKSKPIKNILDESSFSQKKTDEIDIREQSLYKENVLENENNLVDLANNSQQIVEEPELFSEIADIDVNSYEEEDEIIELPDDI